MGGASLRPLVLALLLVVARSRGAVVRAVALALLVLALANPSFTREDRDPLTSVAVVVVDKSPSQNFGDRAQQTEGARAAADRAARAAFPGSKCASSRPARPDGETDGTRLFTALGAALADVPPDRIAGAIMITDGRVHDVPADAARARLRRAGACADHRPARTSATAASARRGAALRHRRPAADRSRYRVEDQGARAGRRDVTVRRDGETLETRNVPRRRAACASHDPDPACRAEHRRDRSLAARRTS